MDNSIITRRKALAAAGALGATAALTGVRSVEAATSTAGAGPLGTFVITVTSATNAQPPFTSLVTFAPGGGFVTISSNNPGDVSLGTWRSDGGSAFRLVFDTFIFDPSGTFQGTAIIHAEGSIDGGHIHGTYRVDVKPPSGPTQSNVDHGRFSGSRLEP